MSEDDPVKHEGKWTRDDLPEPSRLSRLKHEIVKDFFWEDILDEIADHLNAHCPKPAHRLLSSAAECVLGAEDRVRFAKAERDSAVARADQLRDERDDAVQSCMAVGRERDEAVARADHAEKGAWRVRYQHAVAELLDAGRARDEWKARAEALEAEAEEAFEHVAQANQRWLAAVVEGNGWKDRAEKAEADLEELSEEFSDFRVEVVAEAVKYRESHPQASDDDPVVYAVRESDIAAVKVERESHNEWFVDGEHVYTHGAEDSRNLAGGYMHKAVRRFAVVRAIEAEQAADPVEEKAISVFKAAWHEADMRGDQGNRTRRGIRAARKVIEGDGE